MKKKTAQLLLLTLLAASAASCGQVRKSEAAKEHEAWEQSLNDSVAALRASVENDTRLIDSLHQEVGRLLPLFDRIDDPRQVEPFTIRKGWTARYPLTSTGLVARITENENIELVAALAGGTFDRLTVSAPRLGEQSTDVVPHDQALNYRAAGLNTVAFSGLRADSVARLIALAPEGSVTVAYGATSRRLPAAEQQMIADTWRLADAHRQAQIKERQLLITDQKIKILQQRLEQTHTTDNNKPTE